ncbi:hypothetical protein [Terriglobus sp. TAA 43]|uniref:hypothetical protein n=1 Tax=Terriglobus sp. TAA 43 TaxID=278961 RepID=UPI000646373A|nr:hypothetical protein [Terriglobus sp. TAA 43]
MHARKFAVRWLSAATVLCSLPLAAVAQMHKVAKPDQVTRAVALYEYVGDDPIKPKAARLIPVSLFIGGHYEDAGIYLARPVPFALESGIRYDLQKSGTQQNVFDLIASRNFAGSAIAANLPFDDGWFGYGRVSTPKAPKAGRIRPNCGNAHVVQEAPKDDGKPHFGSKSADTKTIDPKATAAAIPDECREEDTPAKVTLDDYGSGKKDKDAADPERPTLHRSPESSAHNTGDQSKANKKDSKKPPEATVTQNNAPADDPDRPTIRHRAAEEDDPNALPPDPMELASRSTAKAAETRAAGPTDARSSANETVAENGTISSGDTMSGGPVLRRGAITTAKDDTQAVVKVKAAAGSTLSTPLESIVAVSDAKDRPQHDFTYKFASNTERATALSALEDLARAVVLNPALATDALETTAAPQAPVASPTKSAKTVKAPAVHTRSTKPTKAAPAPSLSFADEQMGAYQLYFSAPVSYTFFARVPATDSTPERYVTVVANTDPDGTLHPAMRTVTDSTHLDRIPRYRPIDVVDADATNRAEILMELRHGSSRQFALYRLLGNKTDQVFISGTTVL